MSAPFWPLGDYGVVVARQRQHARMMRVAREMKALSLSEAERTALSERRREKELARNRENNRRNKALVKARKWCWRARVDAEIRAMRELRARANASRH